MVQRITKVFGLIALMGLSGIADAQAPTNWALAGPVYNAGRSRNMIVDKNDPTHQTLYVGSASSGIFKSLDGGSSWNPINDQATVRNISYLAQDKNGVIYVGTGEGFLRLGQKAKAQVGTGLYTLSGTNLVPVAGASSSVVGTVINKIACTPTTVANNNVALATNKGIWVSINGGLFTQLSIPTPTGAMTGQDIKFDNNGILYCSIGTEVGTSTVNTTTVWKSLDASITTFTLITPTSPVIDQNYGRVELAIAPSDNNVIYASVANKNTSTPTSPQPSSASLKAIFVSYDAGSTWGLLLQGSPQIDPLSNGGNISSGDYAHVLVVDPDEKNYLFVGGYQLYTFYRYGGTNSSPLGYWTKLGNNLALNTALYLHENIHDIQIVPGNPKRVFFITDAGIYRSSDIYTAYTTPIPLPTFQPFYSGLVTGQFNSVSIERYPASQTNTLGVSNKTLTLITPYSGFAGGTGGNGLNYYSGSASLVTLENSYIGGEVYNTEYSKILPTAVLATSGTGNMYRTGNIRATVPTVLSVNKYTGALSKTAPTAEGFLIGTTPNPSITTGTPFRLWENYGQIAKTPDSLYFYNDTVRSPSSANGEAELPTKTTYTFSCARPNKFALIDSITIRTGTIAFQMESPPNIPAFNLGQLATIKLPNNYAITSSLTVISPTTMSVTGNLISTLTAVSLNSVSLLDNVSITFNSAPFAGLSFPSHTTDIYSQVYRVFATVYYKYKPGDSVFVSDNSISTKSNIYSAKLTTDLNWRFGQAPGFMVSAANTTLAITNPTYYAVPGGYSSTTSPFQVGSFSSQNFTVRTYGDYPMSAKILQYTLTAPTDTNIPLTFSINPGGTTNTTGIFPVSPSVTTTYTITQGSGTLTADTQNTVTVSYVLNPGNITQPTPNFTVNVPLSSSVTVYTLTSVSSDTAVPNGSVTLSAPLSTVVAAGSSVVPFAKNNPRVKVAQWMSARLAMVYNSSNVTNNFDAIVVAKNPLALNDALNLVRVTSAGGVQVYTDDASGNPTNSLITVSGRPTLLEWGKNGSEIYFATDANKLYRVSHINEISDMSPLCYNGKFFSDINKYGTSPSTNINPISPYRTTLIGEFTRQITSISITGGLSVSNPTVGQGPTNILLTFNPAGTGTTGLVMYNTLDARTSSTANIGWVDKTNNLTTASTVYSVNSIYCSLLEKDDPKQVYLGTDNGIFYTSDLATATWSNVNLGLLPNVQIFDIDQQTMSPSDCFNSGQIYVATNGRGVWTNGKYAKHIVGMQEYERPTAAEEVRLHIYPNPSNGNVNVTFVGMEGEDASIQVIDISGRVVKTQDLGTLTSGETTHSFETSSLNSGIYIVNVSSDSGVKRSSKLIVTK